MFDILERLAQLDIPLRVRASHCVLQRFADASCKKCTDVCDVKAITLDRKPIVSQACTGCDACVDVCPTGVFASCPPSDRSAFLHSIPTAVKESVGDVHDRILTRFGDQKTMHPKILVHTRKQQLQEIDVLDISAAKPAFASLRIAESCTLCGLCVDMCPTDALRGDDNLHFSHQACTACNLCVDVCPEKAVRLGLPDAKRIRTNAQETLTKFTKADCIVCGPQRPAKNGQCITCAAKSKKLVSLFNRTV